MENNIYVAVSGGPDSMALLHLLNNGKKKRKAIALHVNYNFRLDSSKETLKLKKYCEKNGIKLIVLNVDDNVKGKYKEKNKQYLARKIRFDFFIKETKNEKKPIIYIAHNKDDFIETAIMQENRSSKYFFYGLKKTSNYQSLIIKRPLLKYWKEDILDFCKKNKIPFSIDESNFEEIYERNKIRANLFTLHLEKKVKIYKHYKSLNKANESKFKKTKQIYNKWLGEEFSWFFFNNIDFKYKNNIIFMYLSNQYFDLKINNNKIKGIIEFLENYSNGKKYRLGNNYFIKLTERKVIIEKE